MPKVKLPRSSPSIDMTPMVDLAFLLVTFFMLTTKFRPEEAVSVTIPFSVSQTKLPDNVTTVSIDSAGRVFYDMDGKDTRIELIQKISDNFSAQLGGKLSGDDIMRFAVMGAFGVPYSQLKQYIESNEEQRKAMNTQSKGIPIDSLPHDELADWVQYGYNLALSDWYDKKDKNAQVTPPRFAIKADGNAKYEVVKKVIDICQKAGIQHFDLITSMKMKKN